MARAAVKELPVEKLLDKEEAKKDFAILSELQAKLPSAARVKIYKREEDGKKCYITSMPAEDALGIDLHEYIKKKYVKKHGGGDYVIEALDSNGNVVVSSTITIAEEVSEEEKTKREEINILKEHEEIMKMREEAFRKLKEAEEEKREAERVKWQTYIEAMQKQWETIQAMYEKQIETLKNYIEKSPDTSTQVMLQLQLEKVSREFENARKEFEMKIKEAQEKSIASEKIYDLVSQLIPKLIDISASKGKDPVEEFTKIVEVIKTTVGEKKDFIESLLENPEKMRIFQKILGIDEESQKKKSLLEEILENPEKFKAVQKILGIEERKSFIEELIENPQKMKVIQKLFGIEEKKSFWDELIEKPEKFELFKKITGMDKTEMLIKHLEELRQKQIEMENEMRNKPVEEPKKDALEQLVEFKQKFEILKSIFQPSQPAKTFMEFLSQIVTSAAPYIVQAVQQYINGVITLEMIRKGLMPKQALLGLMPNLSGEKKGVGENFGTTDVLTESYKQIPAQEIGALQYFMQNQENLYSYSSSGYSGVEENFKKVHAKKKDLVNKKLEQVEKKTVETQSKRGRKRKSKTVNAEEAFIILVEGVTEKAKQNGSLNEDLFVDMMVKGIVANLETHPEWGVAIIEKYGKNLKEEGAKVLQKVLNVEKEKAEGLIEKIAEKLGGINVQ